MKQRAKNGGNDEYFTKVEVARKCISELISLVGSRRKIGDRYTLQESRSVFGGDFE